MKRLNDQEILKAIQTGNNDGVLNHLYSEVLPKVRRMILKNSGREEDARDIFQDTVLIFYKYVKLNRFDGTRDIAGFMYSVARNLWINKVRRESRYVPMDAADVIQEADENILDYLIGSEKARAIEEVMSRAGEDCQRLLTYSIYEKLSFKEIARKMGYSTPDVAKTYAYRCKKKLVQFIKDNPNLISLFKE